MKKAASILLTLLCVVNFLFVSAPVRAESPFSDEAVLTAPDSVQEAPPAGVSSPNGPGTEDPVASDATTSVAASSTLTPAKITKKVIESVTCIEDLDKPLDKKAAVRAAGGFTGKTIGGALAVIVVTSLFGPVSPLIRLVVSTVGGEIGKPVGYKIASDTLSQMEHPATATVQPDYSGGN